MDKWEKKVLSSVFVALATLLLFASGALAEATLVHLVYSGHGSEHTAYIQQRAQEFESANPGINIELIEGGNNDKFYSLVAAGSPPDVIDFALTNAANFASEGYLLDLTPYIERDPDIDFADFAPITLKALTWSDGTFWGLPLDVYPVPVFYSVDAFEEAGLLTPNELGEGWTWDALVEAGRRLTKDENGDGTVERYGFSSGNGMFAHGAFIVQAGGMLFDNYTDPKESRLNTPEVARAMQWYSDLYNVYRIIRTEYLGLQDGSVAMELNAGPTAISLLNGAGVRFDMAVQPKGPANRGAYIAQGSVQILKTTPNPDLAWQWAKFIAGPEAQPLYARATSRLPSYLPALRQFADLVPDGPPHMMEAIIGVTTDPASFHLPLGSKFAEIRSMLYAELRNPIQQGKDIAINSVLEDLHRRANAILQR